jgi:hypothetical protein
MLIRQQEAGGAAARRIAPSRATDQARGAKKIWGALPDEI